MWANDHQIFHALEQACGSKFLAVKFIAEASRKLSGSKYNWSIESRLVSWVISGEMPPKGIHIGLDVEIKEIQDFLSYIDDYSIQQCVLDSYRCTVKAHHLVYKYKNNLNEFQQTRVRVLTRMIWYCCIPEEEHYMAFTKKPEESKLEEKVAETVKSEIKEDPEVEANKEKEVEEKKVEEKKLEEKPAEKAKADKAKIEEKKVEKAEVKTEPKVNVTPKPDAKKEKNISNVCLGQVVFFECVLLHAYPNDSGFEYRGNVQVDIVVNDVVRVKYVRPGSGVVLGYIALKDFEHNK